MKRKEGIFKAASRPAAHLVSRDGRVMAGKALREKVSREQHGRWHATEGRADPIDILHKSDAGRLKDLIPIRYGRMLRSPFAFYRGAASVMAADLAQTPTTELKVQACGDCHLLNFGGFATPERRIVFDINDFDETSPAPWEWDVKRLVASMVLAARSNGLPDDRGRRAAVNCARKYREHMREFANMDPLQVWYAETTDTDFIASLPAELQKSVKKRIEKVAAHSGSEFDFPKLAGEVGGQIRITDHPPLIFRPENTGAARATNIFDELFRAYRGSLSDDRRIRLEDDHGSEQRRK